MEPIQSTTAAESTPPPADTAPDPQLQHAADTLAGQMGGGGGAAEEGLDAPETRREEEHDRALPSRAHQRQQALQGWKTRQQSRNRELRERRALQEQYEARMAETNRLAAQALEALRTGRQPVQEEPEEIPDPTLDPVGFARYMRDSNQRAIQEAVKPFLAAQEAQQQAAQQRWQEGQRTAAQQEAVSAQRDMLDDWRAAYEHDAPELAQGFDDRYVFMHQAISGAWKGLCHPGDEEQLTNAQFFAVTRYAEAVGANPVMFLDQWFEQLAGQFGLAVAGTAPAAQAPLAQPVAVQSETERLARVRARAAGATSAAPRQPGRATTTRSELQDLLRAGVNDINRLRSAALKDAGGNMQQAAVMLQQAAGRVA